MDLTLFDLATGQPVRMVGGYDEFSDRSFADYWGGTSLQRWHFDYRDWSEYPISNLTFQQIKNGLARDADNHVNAPRFATPPPDRSAPPH